MAYIVMACLHSYVPHSYDLYSYGLSRRAPIQLHSIYFIGRTGSTHIEQSSLHTRIPGLVTSLSVHLTGWCALVWPYRSRARQVHWHQTSSELSLLGFSAHIGPKSKNKAPKLTALWVVLCRANSPTAAAATAAVVVAAAAATTTTTQFYRRAFTCRSCELHAFTVRNQLSYYNSGIAELPCSGKARSHSLSRRRAR